MKKIERSTVLFTLSLLIILTLSILVSRFSYAFLESGPVTPGETTGKVVSAEDQMIFTKGEPLSLSFDSSTFTESKTSEPTKPSVKLIANTQTKSAVGVYSLGIKIDTNTFKYTQENKPEIILSVKDVTNTNSPKEITTSIGNKLSYVTATDSANTQIKGFDITDKTGTFNFLENKEIKSTNTTAGVVHQYEFTITFVYYDYDQSINETASLKANAYISDVPES